MESPDASTAPTAADTHSKEVDGKTKRKVTPEQKATKKRPKVTNDDDDAEKAENANDNDTICEFVVENLQACRGHAMSNYSVNLLVGKHGLFDLVLTIFDILRKANLTDDRYGSHLWSITFDGKTYHNGWRDPFHPNGFPDGPTSHIDEQDTRLFSNLGLKLNQKGKFNGRSASFDFIVKKIHGKPQEDVQYPQYSAIQQSYSSALSEDWISTAQVTACLQMRGEWEDYWNGDENASKRDYRTFEIIPCKPLAPQWSPQELEFLGLLINAGHKFAKSWKNILQYALVSRPKAATSGQWYKLQKEAYGREYIGRGKSSAQLTLLAKKLAKSSVESMPKPPTQAEILAERERMNKRREQIRMGRDPDDSDCDEW